MSALIEALRSSEEHYRFSVELNPQIPWISDPKGQIVEVGPRWSELTGTPTDDALGWGWIDSLHPKDWPGVLAHGNKALTSLAKAVPDVRYRVRNSTASSRWGRARPNPRRAGVGRITRGNETMKTFKAKVPADRALRRCVERY